MNRTPCLLVVALMTCSGTLTLAAEPPPTFSGDVARIIHQKCTMCHRPDSSGPFSLITYRDVERRADTIQAVLDTGYMPPWKAVDHGIAFANARGLSDAELKAIKVWIDAGCPEGDRTKTPAPPTFTDGWALGRPDMVVMMNGQFDVPADGPDIYRSFVFPLDLPEDKWVKAIELRPQAKSAVHHALFFVDTSGNARKMDGADGKTGIEGMGFLADFGGGDRVAASSRGGLLERFRSGSFERSGQAAVVNNALSRGFLGGYVPGTTPNFLPGDFAMRLPGGSDIVVQTHFHPSGKAETEQAEIALYFADKKPSRQLVPVMVPAMFGFGAGISIPAGKSNYRIEDSITLPVKTQAIGVSGHAHYVCREMKLTAQFPNGQTTVLLHVDDWDLDWQDNYQFAEPLNLPSGTVLRSEIVYDNSADNPENPHHPPRDIRWGRGSTDEMGSITLQVVVGRQSDEPKLRAAVQRHFRATILDRRSDDLVQMLLQLDDNNDGRLEKSEAPPQLEAQVFRFIDANGDDGLDASEIARLIKLRKRLLGVDR